MGFRPLSLSRQAAQIDMVSKIEFFVVMIVAFAGLAMIVSAATYGVREYGTLVMLAGLAGGVAIPIAVVSLLVYVRRSRILSFWGLLLFPLLVVGAHLLRPEVFLLRLAAVAVALAVGDFLFQALHTWIASRGKAEGFTLHFGHFLLVIVVGTVLAIWWSWFSTGILLLLDGTLLGVVGLSDRS